MAKKQALLNVSVNVSTPEAVTYPNKVKVAFADDLAKSLRSSYCPTGGICVRGNAFLDAQPLTQAAAITFATDKLPGSFNAIPHPNAVVVPAGPNNTFEFTGNNLIAAKCNGRAPYFDNTLVVFVEFGGVWQEAYGLRRFLGMCSDRTECDAHTYALSSMKVKRNVKKPAKKKAVKKKAAKKKAVKKKVSKKKAKKKVVKKKAPG